jgi:hypothetical protein
MADQARITSTEALETFRAALIVFTTKARVSVADASDAVKRTRQWVQHDQRVHWDGEYRRRKKQLEQAQAELISVNGAHQQAARMARQMAVAKAQREVADAEAKLRKLKSWSQNYDGLADPILKRIDRLGQTLNDMPKAAAYLVAVQRALADYSDSAGPPPSMPATASTTEAAPESSPEAQN